MAYLLVVMMNVSLNHLSRKFMDSYQLMNFDHSVYDNQIDHLNVHRKMSTIDEVAFLGHENSNKGNSAIKLK